MEVSRTCIKTWRRRGVYKCSVAIFISAGGEKIRDSHYARGSRVPDNHLCSSSFFTLLKVKLSQRRVNFSIFSPCYHEFDSDLRVLLLFIALLSNTPYSFRKEVHWASQTLIHHLRGKMASE